VISTILSDGTPPIYLIIYLGVLSLLKAQA